jgi:hypothetical protein
MKRNILLLLAFLVNVLHSSCQESSNYGIKKSSLEEFELLNLCHCHEYLMLRHYDYVKWDSEEAKQKRLNEEKYLVFGSYVSSRQFNLYYQEKYDSSVFFKKGLSVYLEGSNLNFKRLDSLYYEPIVQHYIKEEAKTNPVPHFGLRHNNFFWDCFYRVKELPLEKELEYFIKANQ